METSAAWRAKLLASAAAVLMSLEPLDEPLERWLREPLELERSEEPFHELSVERSDERSDELPRDPLLVSLLAVASEPKNPPPDERDEPLDPLLRLDEPLLLPVSLEDVYQSFDL